MSDITTDQKDKLIDDLRSVIANAEELLRSTASDTSATTLALRERVQASLSQAKYNLAHFQEEAIARAKAAGRAADDFVHDHPWKAIGIGAGAGLVIGLLIGRR